GVAGDKGRIRLDEQGEVAALVIFGGTDAGLHGGHDLAGGEAEQIGIRAERRRRNCQQEGDQKTTDTGARQAHGAQLSGVRHPRVELHRRVEARYKSMKGNVLVVQWPLRGTGTRDRWYRVFQTEYRQTWLRTRGWHLRGWKPHVIVWPCRANTCRF